MSERSRRRRTPSSGGSSGDGSAHLAESHEDMSAVRDRLDGSDEGSGALDTSAIFDEVEESLDDEGGGGGEFKTGAKVEVGGEWATVVKKLKPNKKKGRTEELYRVETKDGEVLEVPPGALTPLMTESDRLKADFGKAKSSTDPGEKVAFLRKFNEEYAQHLTGEIEYFQMLAQKLVYLRLEAGQEIACNVDTETRHGVENQLEGERVADENSDYSGMYQVVARYTNMKSANVLLLLPSDKDPTKNAIITFRGTAASIDKRSQQEGESTGVRADLDVKGIGKSAFDLAEPTLRGFLKEAKAYNRITISGHSLGGAMAQRFYAMASSECPDKLRLLVYQSAPVDRATAEEAKRNTEGSGAKATRVEAKGDVVTVGGAANVPGTRLQYDSKKSGVGKRHTQTDLADLQLDRNSPNTSNELRVFMDRKFADLVGDVEKKDKTTTTSGKKLAANAGRSFLGMFNKRKKKASNYDQRLEVMETERGDPMHDVARRLNRRGRRQQRREARNGRQFAMTGEATDRDVKLLEKRSLEEQQAREEEQQGSMGITQEDIDADLFGSL